MPKLISSSTGMRFILILACAFLSGCLGPYTYHQTRGESQVVPALLSEQAIMSDSYTLPFAMQNGDRQPRAIVLALHGFNDYHNAFAEFGNYLAKENIGLITYDQRGFGETEGRGYWHGSEVLVEDLLTMVQLINTSYPDIPIYVLGESMGGAVTLVAAKALQEESEVHGIILVAPAVWAFQTMPWYQRGTLWFLAHAFPWLGLSNQGMDITPSDNIKMLRALGADPLVIKGARADAIYGLTMLMSDALEASAKIDVPALILYGKHDEIVPREPTCIMLNNLSVSGNLEWRFILYENGYHMLTRDLQATQVIADIESWITERERGTRGKNGISEQDREFICQ